MQFTPTHKPAIRFADPRCLLMFDSRLWNEFPRPVGKRKKCEDCDAVLGYYRKEMDLYGSGEPFDEGSDEEEGLMDR